MSRESKPQKATVPRSIDSMKICIVQIHLREPVLWLHSMNNIQNRRAIRNQLNCLQSMIQADDLRVLMAGLFSSAGV